MSDSSRIVLFSGEIGAGKTSVSKVLLSEYDFQKVSTGEFLMKTAVERGIPTDRRTLQNLGDEFDVKTNGIWVVDLARKNVAGETTAPSRLLLDAVRKEIQIQSFRNEFPGTVLHAHVFAPDYVLRERFEKRRKAGYSLDGATSYEEAKKSATEQGVRVLREIADVLLDTSAFSPSESAKFIVSKLNSLSEMRGVACDKLFS